MYMYMYTHMYRVIEPGPPSTRSPPASAASGRRSSGFASPVACRPGGSGGGAPSATPPAVLSVSCARHVSECTVTPTPCSLTSAYSPTLGCEQHLMYTTLSFPEA